MENTGKEPCFAGLDAELRAQLEAIRREDVPEKLLQLARALQQKLREAGREH